MTYVGDNLLISQRTVTIFMELQAMASGLFIHQNFLITAGKQLLHYLLPVDRHVLPDHTQLIRHLIINFPEVRMYI